MDLKLDRYTWQARTLPVYFVGAPAVLAIGSTLPEGLNLSFAGVSGLVLVPVSFFLSQVAADNGKRLETELWRSWGGPPTTRFLTHGNTEFNAETRLRTHNRLRGLGMNIPTAQEQAADPNRALDLYASAVDELRRLTREPGRFPLVLKGNVEYGFRRNLLGMKKLGVGVAVASLATSCWSLWRGWAFSGELAPLPLVTVLVIAGIVIGWLFRVRADAVRVTADRYARFLLEAAGDPEAQ